MAPKSKLLEMPPWDELETYYKKITAHHRGVQVAMTSSMGKGLFASTEFKQGEVVLREPMLVGMQHTANKAHALVCGFCLRFVGSVELQIARQLPLGQLLHKADESEEEEGSTDSEGSEGAEEEHNKDEEDEVQENGSGAEVSNGALTETGDPSNGPSCSSAEDLTAHKRSREVSEGGASPGSDRAGAASGGISARVQDFLEGRLRLPWTDKFPLPQPVDCRGGCDAQVFCSTECMEAAWESFHCLLCPGPKGRAQNAEALSDFAHHADETNDIFHLAAAVIAKTMLAARQPSQREAEASRKESRARGKTPGQLEQAWLPFAAGHKALWWDALAKPQDVPQSEEQHFRGSICNTAATSLALLKEAICSEDSSELFTLEVYGSIIGMFELNNLEVLVVSPLAQYRGHLERAAKDTSSASEQQGKAEVEDCRREAFPLRVAVCDMEPMRLEWKVEGLALLNELAAVLDANWAEPCRGTAFYALQSCVNHSCAPNAFATKDANDFYGDAVILAKRTIKPGEEITLSYIDEGSEYHVRQDLLRDYGFLCHCKLCARQKQEG